MRRDYGYDVQQAAELLEPGEQPRGSRVEFVTPHLAAPVVGFVCDANDAGVFRSIP